MPSVKAGRYQIQEELGRGAMGVVWKAFDPTIGRTVAVKTMKLTEEDSGLSRAELINRFQNETRAAGLLTHPNIVVVYDAGEDEGTFYITMEYVEGRSLLSVIERKQAFPVARILKVMEQACAALDYAHQRNVVHRDIKPANILLAPDDTVKITDFGTAKIIQMGTTQTGHIVGTPSYMSPEQVKGKPIDGRADLFSLGVILYELATGEKPFPGQNITTVIYKIVNEEPIPARELDSSVHPGLNYVITKALEKDPANRYQSCRALMEDLKSYRQFGGESSLGATVVASSKPRSAPVVPPAASETISAGPMAPPVPAASGPAEASPAPAATPAAEPLAKPPEMPPAPTETTSRKVAIRPPQSRPISLTLEPEPQKRSGAIWLVLILLAGIAGGGYFMWPQIRERLKLGGAGGEAAATQPAAPAVSPDTAAKSPEPPASKKAAEPAALEASRQPAKEETTTPAKSAKAEAAAPAKADPAEMKAQLERRIAQAGVSDKVRVEIRGRTLALEGTLTPAERRRLMQLIRGPDGVRGGAGLRLDDRIQLARAAPGEEAEKPRTAPGLGEIEVVTDVLGATAQIKGPGGSPSADCKTPCRFEELPPGRYTMDVALAGYRPIKRILNVRAGNIVEENLQMQALTSQVEITSRPERAAIYVNGQRRSETTPATLVLPPGSYDVALEKAGYDRHEVNVQLRTDEMKRVTVDLVESRGAPAPAAQAPAPAPVRPAPTESRRAVGWIDVRSVPLGADILLGNTNTGSRTPARIELAPGEYTVVIYLKGYQAVRKTVTVQEGRTVALTEVLQK